MRVTTVLISIILLSIFMFSTLTYAKTDVKLRKFPFPYQSMLAISTDIDGASIHNFREIHRFLHTFENTKMGKGLGLDIADSFWFYVGTDKEGYIDPHKYFTWKEQMSYFKGTDPTQEYTGYEIRDYIKAGWIDSIHSFGDFSRIDKRSSIFNRSHAVHAVNELNNHQLGIKVWINHGSNSNIQNFGGNYYFTRYQQGDRPWSRGYHTDLTIPSGLQFLWDSQGDSQIGHDSLIYPIYLKDGQTIWGYKRFTQDIYNGQLRWIWGPEFLNVQLSKENLDKIVSNNWYSVISQHLNNVIQNDRELPTVTIEGLTRLKNYQDAGKILVARTSRILEYNRNHHHVKFDSVEKNNAIEIHIRSVDDPLLGHFIPTLDQIRGLTFYVANPENAKLYIQNKEVPKELLQLNPSDGYMPSLGIKWFDQDYTDHTRQLTEIHIKSDLSHAYIGW